MENVDIDMHNGRLALMGAELNKISEHDNAICETSDYETRQRSQSIGGDGLLTVALSKTTSAMAPRMIQIA